MKTIPNGPVMTIAAGEDIVANRLIGFDGKYCSANAKALGVSEIDADNGKDLAVRFKGIALVTAGAAISVGAAVKAATGGKAVEADDVTTEITVTPTVSVDITASGTIPEGSTNVTSTSAQPTVSINASADVDASATATAEITGSVLPEAINGYALDAASGDGDIIRVLLV